MVKKIRVTSCAFCLARKKHTNFVCYCDKLFQAVLRRNFHRRTIIPLSIFTERMDRTGAAYSVHLCLCTLQVNPSKKAAITDPSLAGTIGIPQHIWWLDLPDIHFEAFPKETQCPWICFEGACGSHWCVICLFHTSHRKYHLSNGDISIWCVVSSLHPSMAGHWDVFPGGSWLECRLQGKSCPVSTFLLKAVSKA